MLSFFFFFLSVMVQSCSLLVSALSSASSVGFSGSRSALPPSSVWSSVVSSVPAGVSVLVGCAGGLDSSARVSFPSARVFHRSAFGSGRASFARRSSAVVASVLASGSGVWVSFPACPCPVGLLPSASSSACFCGLGSGSWASLAFAVGLGLPCFLWLPAGVAAPAGWGFVSLGFGWFFTCQGC